MHLEELYLAHNHITSIPAGIVNLKALTTFDISYNDLRGYPFPSGVDLPQFPRLSIIYLGNNVHLDPLCIPYKIRALYERFPITRNNEKRRTLVKRNLTSRKRVAALLLDLQLREAKTPLQALHL